MTCGVCGESYGGYGPMPGDPPGTLRAFWHGGHEQTCAGSWEPHPATELRPPDPARERHTGRYAQTKLDRRCVCGHRLGQHTAERQGPPPRRHGRNGRPGGAYQPCLEAGCDCACFTRAPGRT